MCTLTLVRSGPRRLRIVCNRDEQRSRAAALAPARLVFGERAGLMPIDPVSRGSWIGVNDAGLVVAVINANPEGGARAGARSRGGLVPAMLASGSIAGALARAEETDATLYAPFTLLLATLDDGAVLTSDGQTLRVAMTGAWGAPLMLTSSGLGDHMVASCRRGLFEELCVRADDPLEAQRAFHEHAWADRPHLSVLMSRADARTVSRTVVDLDEDRVTMSYAPLDEGGAPERSFPLWLAIDRTPVAP